MTYELAKKLKDAGFKQTCTGGGYLVDSDGREYNGGEHWKQFNYVPTLEELIDACGKEFKSLYLLRTNSENKWEAQGVDYSPQTYGKTPLIAVANLYLALKKAKQTQ